MKFSEDEKHISSENIFDDTFLLQSPFYALLAVLIPLSILVSFLPLAALLLQSLLDLAPFPLGLYFGFALFSATTASIYWAIIKKSKADHKAANVRGAILIVILTYSLGSLLRFNISLGIRFFPSFFNIPSALCALAIWFPVLAIKRIFNGQELFESHIRTHQGEKLRQVMLQDSGLVSETDEDLKKLIKYFGGFFIPPILLLLVCGAIGIPLSIPLLVLLMIIFTFGIAVITFMIFLRREYVYATEGLSLSGRARALTAAVLLVLAVSVLGFIFSSNRSLLNPGLIAELIRRFLAFLASLSRPSEETIAPPEMQIPRSQQLPGLPRELLELADETESSNFWEYAQYGILALLIFLFIWFMINPLLGRSKLFRGIRSLPGIALSALRFWLKAMVQGFTLFFKSLGEGSGGKLPSVSMEAIRRLEDHLLEGYSAAKKRELRRSISLFARLIYWGTEVLKVSWKPSHAPVEYCNFLANAAKEAATGETRDIIRAGNLFEKALYSSGPLSRKERDEFKQLVETITD